MSYALYLLRFADGGFYVGATCDAKRREVHHEQMARVYSGLINFTFEILAEYSSQVDAEAAETWLIAEIRATGADVRNVSTGGRCGKGTKRNERHRQRVSASAKEVWQRPGYRERQSELHRGRVSARRKIQPEQADLVRFLVKSGRTQKSVAREMGLSQSSISNILCGTYDYSKGSPR